jgi:hypothetical protein
VRLDLVGVEEFRIDTKKMGLLGLVWGYSLAGTPSSLVGSPQQSGRTISCSGDGMMARAEKVLGPTG